MRFRLMMIVYPLPLSTGPANITKYCSQPYDGKSQIEEEKENIKTEMKNETIC